eukprot:tig00000595_g2258.t1
MLSFTIAAPAENPFNTLAVETPYDVLLTTSCGNFTLPKSYVFFLPSGTESRLQVVGVYKRGCNFDSSDAIEVYLQLPDKSSKGWQVAGYRGPERTCGMRAKNATVASSEMVDFASPEFTSECIRNNVDLEVRRAILQGFSDQRALNTRYDVVLISAIQGPFVLSDVRCTFVHRGW